MNQNRMPIKSFLVLWYRLSRDMLFSGLQREKYRPVSILAQNQEAGTLSSLRQRHKGVVDDLVDTVLSTELFAERDALLAATDPVIVALYFDRIHEATLKLEELCLRYTHLGSNEPSQDKFVRQMIRRLLVGESLPFQN